MEFDSLVDIERFQIIAIIGSAFYIICILYLVRSKRLREDYSLLWLFFGVLFLGLSIWRSSLEYISHAMGIAYAPAAIFILLIMALFLITIQFSIFISRQANQIAKLAQEIAFIKQKHRENEAKK